MGPGVSCGEHQQRLASAALRPHGLTFPASGSCRNKRRRFFKWRGKNCRHGRTGSARSWRAASRSGWSAAWTKSIRQRLHLPWRVTAKMFSTDKKRVDAGTAVRGRSRTVRVFGKSGNGWTPQSPAWTFWRSTASKPHGGDEQPLHGNGGRQTAALTPILTSQEGFYAISNAGITARRASRNIWSARKAYQLVYDLNPRHAPDPTGMD